MWQGEIWAPLGTVTQRPHKVLPSRNYYGPLGKLKVEDVELIGFRIRCFRHVSQGWSKSWALSGSVNITVRM